MMPEEQISLLKTTLIGLRGMAEVETAAGSRVWKAVIGQIDEVLTLTREEQPKQKEHELCR